MSADEQASKSDIYIVVTVQKDGTVRARHNDSDLKIETRGANDLQRQEGLCRVVNFLEHLLKKVNIPRKFHMTHSLNELRRDGRRDFGIEPQPAFRVLQWCLLYEQ